MKRKTLSTVILMIAIFAAGAVTTAHAQQVEFNYNGRVKVQGQPFHGTGFFKFTIVSQNGQETFWGNDGATLDGSEPATSIMAPVDNGFFSVNIGDITLAGMAMLNKSVFERDENMFLRVWFSDGGGFERLHPDSKISNPELLGLKISRNEDYAIYVNASSGSDTNSGLSPAKPKRTIQSAVDSLPALLKCNVTIDIADGVYREMVSIQQINVLSGKRLVLLGDDSWTTASVGNPAVRITGSDDDVNPVRNTGIHIQQSSGIAIRGLQIEKTSHAGIFAALSSYVEIEGCRLVENCRFEGREFEDAPIALQSCTLVTVKECISESNNSCGMIAINSSFFVRKSIMRQNHWDGLYTIGCYFQIESSKFLNNGRCGVSISRNTSVEIYGDCEFSYNGFLGPYYYSGLQANQSAQVLFGNGRPYSAKFFGNAAYGIHLSYLSSTRWYAAGSTFSGNASGSTYAPSDCILN